jgi:hypothetical protein
MSEFYDYVDEEVAAIREAEDQIFWDNRAAKAKFRDRDIHVRPTKKDAE